MGNLQTEINDYLLEDGFCATPQLKTIFKEETWFTKELTNHSIKIRYMKGENSEGYLVSMENDIKEIIYLKKIEPSQFLSEINFVLQDCRSPSES